MESNDQDFVEMYTNNIHQYNSFNELKEEIQVNEKAKHLSKETLKKIEDHFNKYGRKTKYWMLICNPSKWREDTELYEVNDLLENLDKEPWKINDRTSMEREMKKGDFGIIKVSNDTRSEINRIDDNGDIVPLLEAGIYAIFEVIHDEFGRPTFKGEDGNFYVNTQVTNNLFKKKKNINKENSIKLLGKNLYASIPSTKIDKTIYENVLKYIGNK